MTDKKNLEGPTQNFCKKFLGTSWIIKSIFLGSFKTVFEPFWRLSVDLGRIYIAARHFLEYHFWPISKNWGLLHRNFLKNVWGNHWLSRVLFWDHFKKFGFWKPFYTCPPHFVAPFLTDKQKLRIPTPHFWKKCRRKPWIIKSIILGSF